MIYHVTTVQALPSILEYGIIPSIGPRSETYGETTKLIYAFSNLTDVEDALVGWLGDELSNDDDIVVLCLDIDAEPQEGHFEITIDYIVPPERIISVLNEDLSQKIEGPGGLRQATWT